MLSVKKPTFFINKSICLSNISKMADHARMNQVIFRPHFKTHQSLEIGNWFKSAGIKCITVSSVQMAAYFAEDWDDITIAFPVNVREMDEINALAVKARLNLLLESAYSAAVVAGNAKHEMGFFIKIDTGYHRTGIDASDLVSIDAVIEAAAFNPLLEFRGFLTHTGQTYHARGPAEIMKFQVEAGEQLLQLKQHYSPAWPELILSTGDTPSCSLLDPFPGIDEIRPGNFVYYDLMQANLGSCRLEDIAVAVVCPVVSVNAQRQEAVIYGGAVHLSKERIRDAQENEVYGLAVRLHEEGWDVNQIIGSLTTLSQEHGVIRMEGSAQLKPGDLVAVLPVHSCLTADLMMGKPREWEFV